MHTNAGIFADGPMRTLTNEPALVRTALPSIDGVGWHVRGSPSREVSVMFESVESTVTFLGECTDRFTVIH